jgi:hypothetical protein
MFIHRGIATKKEMDKSEEMLERNMFKPKGNEEYMNKLKRKEREREREEVHI